MITATSVNASHGDTETTVARVVIIRHGEKPDEGDNLSCQGLNRSLQLPNVLYTKFGIPSHTYVPCVNNGKSTNNSRMFQTVTPFAAKYNLTIDTRFNEQDTGDLATSILKKNGTVLVVWEHKALPSLLKELGIKDANLKWEEDDFDSIWIVTFSDGVPTLTIDKEDLNPSPDCP